MKRYFLFAGDTQDDGDLGHGYRDYIGSVETLKEAYQKILDEREHGRIIDWAHLLSIHANDELGLDYQLTATSIIDIEGKGKDVEAWSDCGDLYIMKENLSLIVNHYANR